MDIIMEIAATVFSVCCVLLLVVVSAVSVFRIENNVVKKIGRTILVPFVVSAFIVVGITIVMSLG